MCGCRILKQKSKQLMQYDFRQASPHINRKSIISAVVTLIIISADSVIKQVTNGRTNRILNFSLTLAKTNKMGIISVAHAYNLPSTNFYNVHNIFWIIKLNLSNIIIIQLICTCYGCLRLPTYIGIYCIYPERAKTVALKTSHNITCVN